MASLVQNKDFRPAMSVILPANYEANRKLPLLVFLIGGDGGRGTHAEIPARIAEGNDFICVNLPFFKVPDTTSTAPVDLRLSAADFKYTWPYMKTMLAKLDELVPNIDAAHRVMGGFSNGAHTTAGLICNSDGEMAGMFSAFFFVEGGGRCDRYDLIKGKPLLLLYGEKSLRPERLREIKDAADSAGVNFTVHEMKGVGHDFPIPEYPAVREWLRGSAAGGASPSSAPAMSATQPAKVHE
jgi:predicted esterase